MHVLLIDDDEVNNFICTRLLERSSPEMKVTCVTSAEDGLSFLEQARMTNTVPDLILLDINMPVMDGWGFLAEYQHTPEDMRQAIRLFMLSSSMHQADIDRSRKCAEIEDYISKPLTMEAIRRFHEPRTHLRTLTA